MCLISCNTFQKHLLRKKENLIFWLQKWIFEISESIFDSFWHPKMRKRHGKATLKVSKKFWDLQSKIGSIRLLQMFWRLIWYHSRGHTTKIDFGKRSRLKKKQKLSRSEPFEIIGFKCWLIFGLAHAVGKNSSKNAKKGNCWLKVRGFWPLSWLGVW